VNTVSRTAGGLAHIDAVLEHNSKKRGELANYYLAHSAGADMYRRRGKTAEGQLLRINPDRLPPYVRAYRAYRFLLFLEHPLGQFRVSRVRCFLLPLILF
jgi:hypothetical protein